MSTLQVPVAKLTAFAATVFRKAGLGEAEATTGARLMIESDLAGQDGHGIFRLASYIAAVRAGKIVANGQITVASEAPASALIDGGNALGHLVMARAAEVAIAKAKTQGTAWVGTRMSNHAGAASVWAAQMLPHDMIGLYFAVGPNFMAPWGGFEKLLGTNPLAIAVPALDEPPVVLDMATSIAANGKVQMAKQRGETIPAGWLSDKQGQPITDPARADEGTFVPVGEYKGFGLSLMIGLLGATLNNAAFGRAATQTAVPSNTGQALCAISISQFGDVTEFKRRVDAVVRDIRGSGRLPGVEVIRLPGERSHALRMERMRTGIPIPPGLKAQLDKLAAELDISPLTA